MRKITSVVILLLATVVGSASAASAQLTFPDKPSLDGPDEVSLGPVVALNWQMPNRYSLVPRTFADINPSSWRIDVDTCGSYAREGTVRSIRWVLKDRSGRVLLDTTTCKRSANVPSLGAYTIEVTVVTTNGTGTRVFPIEVKDHLIVVAGDSMASGEGNPDVKGDARIEVCGQSIDPSNSHLESTIDPGCIFDLIDLFGGDIPSVLDGQPSTWRLDPDCHRSYRSGLSLAARDIETRDPHSSVTFVNVACSGAEVPHLFSDTYDGLYTDGPWDTGVKPPQADQIAALVCGRIGSCDERARPVDGIFVSIGINDLKLSDVLKDCMKPDFKQVLGIDGCHDTSAGTIGEGLAGLDVASGMANRLAALGVPVRSVYQSLYPTHVFDGPTASCGVFLFINPMEKEWLQESNVKLNEAVYRAYSPHTHWRPAWRDLMTDPWKGHGYCAGSNRYFVSLFDSITQYNGLGDKATFGAVHPNAKGHDVLRKEFLNEYLQRTRPVTDRFVVAIDGVQVKTIEKAMSGWLMFSAARLGTDGIARFGTNWNLRVPFEIDPRPGQWIDLRSRNIQLPMGVNSAEELRVLVNSASTMPPERTDCPDPRTGTTTQRLATNTGGSGTSTVPCLLPVFRGFQMSKAFGEGADWGVGSHTLVHDSGNFVVRYRILRVKCSICDAAPLAPEVSSPTR